MPSNNFLKVVMISGSDFGQMDGPVLHFSSLVKELIKKNVNAKAIGAIRKSRRNSHHQHILLIRVPDWPVVNVIFFQCQLFFLLFWLFLFSRPNCLYVRLHYGMIIPFIMAKVFGLPAIVEFNGLIEDHEGKRAKFITKIGRVIEYHFTKYGSGVIVITPLMKEWVMENYRVFPKKIFIVPNAADPERFRDMTSERVRKALGWPTDKKITVYVGSLTWWQGVDQIVQAFQKTHSKITDSICMIAGAGPEEARLNEFVNGHNLSTCIKFLGRVDEKMAAYCMVGADVCVMAKVSTKSGWAPLKLYEYMMAGKPIIASRVEGFEIIEQLNIGRLFNPGDIVSLSNALEDIFSLSFEERIQMGKRAREYAIKHHTWEQVADKTIAIINETCLQ